MINWTGKSKIEVRGTSFAVAVWGAPPSSDILKIMKEPFQIDLYGDLAEEVGTDANIVELGIRTGASTAFLAVLFKPQLLAAFEIAEEASSGFDAFLESHPDAARIRAHYECDQGNAAQLRSLLDDDFGEDLLDLVIDDASHMLVPSTVSFNVLFPRLRPGGIFVLEDWSWEHYAEGMVGPDFSHGVCTSRTGSGTGECTPPGYHCQSGASARHGDNLSGLLPSRT